MAQQIQVQKQRPPKRPRPSADAPTVRKDIARKWFSEES